MPRGGRPTNDLQSSKERILDLHRQGYTYDDIAKDVNSTECTVRRRLSEWGIQKRALAGVRNDPVLRAQVAMHYMSRFTNDEITIALNSDWSLEDCINKYTVIRICKSQGIIRRMSAWDWQEANKKLWDVIQKELDSGAIEGYGKGLLYTHFKRLGYQVSRLVVYLIYPFL